MFGTENRCFILESIKFFDSKSRSNNFHVYLLGKWIGVAIVIN